MHLWRYPSLSIHGIEGAFAEPGMKTVVPGRVTGKFSIRLVPYMDPPVVERQVRGCPAARQYLSEGCRPPLREWPPGCHRRTVRFQDKRDWDKCEKPSVIFVRSRSLSSVICSYSGWSHMEVE